MRDARKGKSKAARVRVHFTPEEIAAAKAQLRQVGVGSLSDYVRWLLRRALTRTGSAQEEQFGVGDLDRGKSRPT